MPNKMTPNAISQSRSLPAGYVFRAWRVLTLHLQS
jgi:hypothetical protein